MKNKSTDKSSNALKSQIIRPEKHEKKPDQFHTPEGPAEEFIQEDLNTSHDEPTHRNTSVLKR